MSNVSTGNRYFVFDEVNEVVVEGGFATRSQARMFKRDLDYKTKAANQFRNTPSNFKVYTDMDHPRGPGIYLH